MNSRNNVTLSVIGYYQLIGGVLGIVLLMLFVVRFAGVASALTLITTLSIFGTLFVFSITAGLLLILKKYKWGKPISIVNQFLQVFCVSIGGFGFKYIAGVSILLYFESGDSFSLGTALESSAFAINLSSMDTGVKVGINLVPFIVVYFLTSYLSAKPNSPANRFEP